MKMNRRKQKFEEILESEAMAVEIDDNGMLLSLHKSDISNLAERFGAFNVPTIPEFIHYYYEELEYWEQLEFSNVPHVLEGVYAGSYESSLRFVSMWIKEQPKAYISFVEAITNGGVYIIDKKYYAVFDSQIDGFKAGMAYDNKYEAREGLLDRIYNIHRDMYESDGYDSWEDFMREEEWNDDDLIEFQGYEIREVNETDFEKILNSDEVGLLTSVNLDD